MIPIIKMHFLIELVKSDYSAWKALDSEQINIEDKYFMLGSRRRYKNEWMNEG